jgi:DNA-binding response OmpR family regulator
MILIVDDDPAITTLLKMSFELEGHLVMTAADGIEALALARRIHPAAMVVDVMMPEMDGLELVRQLRSNAATAGIPIVCCSAKSLAVDVEAGLAAGADDYVAKPCDPLDLVARVERVAHGASSRHGRSADRGQGHPAEQAPRLRVVE